MSDAQKKAIRNYRSRLNRRGLARVEVLVPRADAALLRDIAKALADPDEAGRVRAALQSLLQTPKSIYSGMSLKELLENAPLEGVDLTRDKDLGRDIDL